MDIIERIFRAVYQQDSRIKWSTRNYVTHRTTWHTGDDEVKLLTELVDAEWRAGIERHFLYINEDGKWNRLDGWLTTLPNYIPLLTLLDDADKINDVWQKYLDTNVANVWATDRNHRYYGVDRDQFVTLADILTNDTVRICTWCSTAVFDDDAVEIYVDPYNVSSGRANHNDAHVCDDCYENAYITCDQCSHVVLMDDSFSQGDYVYCESCHGDLYSYCDECEEYFSNDENHSHGCNCEAPHRHFRFPNGTETIGANERVTLELPKGEIDENGIEQIAYNVWNHFYYHRTDVAIGFNKSDVLSLIQSEVGHEWQTKRGNFTRRLSGALHKKWKVKLTPEAVSQIGNTARQHTADETSWHIELTRDLNMPAEQFANEESCWWESYWKSRCVLKNWGGLGLRTFGDSEGDDVDDVTGRAWVQPLKISEAGADEAMPTHDVVNANAYVVFNIYGDDLTGFIAAKLVAQLTGMSSYTRIEFDATDQYVNGEVGYLVSDAAICAGAGRIYLSGNYHDKRDANTVDPLATAK